MHIYLDLLGSIDIISHFTMMMMMMIMTMKLFVCVEVLQPSQPNGVMSSAVSLPNHTFRFSPQSG